MITPSTHHSSIFIDTVFIAALPNMHERDTAHRMRYPDYSVFPLIKPKEKNGKYMSGAPAFKNPRECQSFKEAVTSGSIQ
jgi:hypothetical protein